MSCEMSNFCGLGIGMGLASERVVRLEETLDAGAGAREGVGVVAKVNELLAIGSFHLELIGAARHRVVAGFGFVLLRGSVEGPRGVDASLLLLLRAAAQRRKQVLGNEIGPDAGGAGDRELARRLERAALSEGALEKRVGGAGAGRGAGGGPPLARPGRARRGALAGGAGRGRGGPGAGP